jgi:two-component system, sensor histidine kinase and response regulator
MSRQAAAPLLDRANPAAPLSGADGLELVVQMAHDLRSPLSSILVLADALQSGATGPVTDAQREQLRLIYTAAMHLCGTATDVLELARAGGRGAGEPATAFSIDELFGTIADMTRPMCTDRGIELRFVAPRDDWRLGRPRTLARVLLNLVTNALKVTSEGFVDVRAWTQPRDPSRVQWSVRDTGPGLTVDQQRALYRPFPTGDGGVAQFSSAGLGLGICRKLVASMDATLHVETHPDWGTRFHFEIEAPPVGD